MNRSVKSHKHLLNLLINILAFGYFLSLFSIHNAYANIFGPCSPWCDGDERQVAEPLQKFITQIEEGGEPLRAEASQLLGEVSNGQLQQQIAASPSIDLAPVKDVVHQIVEDILVRLPGSSESIGGGYKIICQLDSLFPRRQNPSYLYTTLSDVLYGQSG